MTTTQLSGLEVFNTQGCAACHTIDGVGGTGGPGLSKAGFRWDAAAIRDPDRDTQGSPDASLLAPQPSRTSTTWSTYLVSLQ